MARPTLAGWLLLAGCALVRGEYVRQFRVREGAAEPRGARAAPRLTGDAHAHSIAKGAPDCANKKLRFGLFCPGQFGMCARRLRFVLSAVS